MNPVMIHADGTDCDHVSHPQATVRDGSGPLCPGGLPVTQVRFNGKTLTIEEARVAFQAIIDAFAAAFAPMIEAAGAVFGALGNALSPAAQEGTRDRLHRARHQRAREPAQQPPDALAH